MGKLYLAYASPDYLACYWARNQHEIQPLTEHTIVTKADMQTELFKACNKRGLCNPPPQRAVIV